jgi:HD-GYP domain-containing protein (c-di-GMP phosphodiesterase class II)
MLSETEKLASLADLGITLSQVKDVDILMEHVLGRARQVVNADAGSIYIKEDDQLHFTYTQNDTLQRRLSPGEKLIYSTFKIPINEKSIAGYVATTGHPLIIDDAYQMDPTKPYHFSKSFDQTSRYTSRSVLTIPLKTLQDNIVGILQIINAQDEDKRIIPFTENDEKMMMHFAGIAALALERAQMTRAILLRMIRMAEMRDPKETGAHVNRVGAFSLELYETWAEQRQIRPEEVDKNRDILRMAAMLHDVGKVAISDTILKKPGRLTPQEFETMQQHTVMGAQLFNDRQSDFDAAAAEVALNHHERWNGMGYPGYVDLQTGRSAENPRAGGAETSSKQGEDIPIFGRIVALADVYDALSHARCYKDAWDESKVLSVIEKEAGEQFDPDLVKILFAKLDVFRAIRRRYADDE